MDIARVIDARVSVAYTPGSPDLDLEQLSVSFMVNAEDSFQACVQTWTWQHM